MIDTTLDLLRSLTRDELTLKKLIETNATQKMMNLEVSERKYCERALMKTRLHPKLKLNHPFFFGSLNLLGAVYS